LDGEPRIKYTGHMKMISPPMAKPASWRVNARHSTHTIADCDACASLSTTFGLLAGTVHSHHSQVSTTGP
jgi:hypothetical protein